MTTESATATPPEAVKTCPGCGRQLEAWAHVCPDCSYEGLDLDPVDSDDPKVQRALLSAYDDQLQRRSTPPWMVYLLIGLNAAYFLVMCLAGVSPLLPSADLLFKWGGNFPPVTAHGEPWRLLSATFVHAGILHVGFNLLILWQVGRRVERLFGHGAFLVAYLASGLLASITSMVFHWTNVTVGASGAIFGIIGVLLGYLVRDREALPKAVFRGLGKGILMFLLYNLLFGLQVKNVDLSAHVGGLAAGFLCGLVLVPAGDPQVPARWRRLLATGSASLAVAGVLFGAIRERRGPAQSLTELGVDREVLAGQVLAMVREQFQARPDTRAMEALEVSFDRQQGHDFEGRITCRVEGESFTRPIRVHFENGMVRWEIL